MKNNIETIDYFFQNNSNNLIINKVSDEIDYFYFYIIAHFAQKYKFEISHNSANPGQENDDLFGRKEIKIIFSNSLLQINKLIQNNDKKIFFTNYKIFKSLNRDQLSVNTYNFKSDVLYFLVNILKIHDQTLHSHVINYPVFTYSEISKYIINDKVTVMETVNDNTDQLLEIRKKLYQSKNDENINYQLFYQLLKEEVNFKKFNF